MNIISKQIRKQLTVSLFLFFGVTSGFAQTAVWQWSVPVQNARQNSGQSRAFLWIPTDCRKVKGVIFAQNNMEEQSILENAKFRAGLAKLGLAEVWVSPAFDLIFNFSQGAGETFNSIMKDLAQVSGYAELTYAPFIGMGHSAAASNPYYMAVWNPQRALAAISVSGQWPYFRSPQFAPDIWNHQELNNIPCLETMGEYESAENWANEGLKERASHPQLALSMLSGPGEWHFNATQDKVDFLVFYIKKVVQYRLSKQETPGTAPLLTPINPIRTGWLVERWHKDASPRFDAAPVNEYKGDPTQAFWYFDEETAKYIERYQAKYLNKKHQLISFLQNGQTLSQKNVHQQINLKFEPLADGVTFKLQTRFYDTVPGGSPRPSAWTGQPAGATIGHAAGGGPIHVERITGPFEVINDSTFRVHPQAGFWQQQHSYELWFAASHPGDEAYRPAVQQALMQIPPTITEGRTQHISFDPIPDQRKGNKPVQLNAKSDANVPVGFYIQDGPAIIKGNRIYLTRIPPRASFPVKVTVVAWQYGNLNEPKLQTAEQVTRTFLIRK